MRCSCSNTSGRGYNGSRFSKSNPISFIDLVSSRDYYTRPSGVVGVCEKSHLGMGFLRGSMCAEGLGCEWRWVRWELRGTGTASGHPRVS